MKKVSIQEDVQSAQIIVQNAVNITIVIVMKDTVNMVMDLYMKMMLIQEDVQSAQIIVQDAVMIAPIVI